MLDIDGLVLAPCMEAFAEPVTYAPKGGLPFGTTGVYDRAYLELLPMGGGRGMEPQRMGSGGNVSSARPVLGVRLADFPQPPQQDDALQVRGIPYVVKEVRPDGHGWAKLLLSKAPGT